MRYSLLIPILLLLTACTPSVEIGEDVIITELLTNLNSPWGMAFITDTEMLITERTGSLLFFDMASGELQNINNVPEVDSSGQGGLLDVAYDTGYVYLTYAGRGEGGTTTHLARAKLENLSLTQLEILHIAEPFMRSGAHYGSRVLLDGEYVYTTFGDRGRKDFGPEHISQDNTNTLGTIIRLYKNGSTPADNPFGDAIYTYGHRNVQGITKHPETGDIWISEHGERDGDALHILEKGGNYGWPIAHYGCRYGTNRPVADPPTENPSIIHPVYHWECGSGGFPPAGMTFYTHDRYPAWQNNLFVGNLAGKYLGKFTVENGHVSEEEPVFQGYRVRDVVVSPDGEMYAVVDEGILFHIALQ